MRVEEKHTVERAGAAANDPHAPHIHHDQHEEEPVVLLMIVGGVQEYVTLGSKLVS